jgi:hypothetical protein
VVTSVMEIAARHTKNLLAVPKSSAKNNLLSATLDC